MSGGIRVGKRATYTNVPNSHRPVDGNLSARAWGVYVYLLSMPPDWETSARHLSKSVFREGRDAILTALHELVSAGLMVIEEYRIGNLPVTRFAIPDDEHE